MAANLLALSPAEFLQGGAIGAKTVGDDGLGPAMALHGLVDELQRCGLRSLVTKDSSTSPSWSTARRGRASRVDADVDLVETPSPLGVLAQGLHPLLPGLVGEHGPKRRHQSLTVFWQRSIPRSCSRSSTLRSDSGYFTYIITTSRITSGELSNQRNGSGGGLEVLRRGMPKGVGEGVYRPFGGRYTFP